MRVVMICLLVFLDVVCAKAQNYIEPVRLEVSASKTVSIVFPAGIVSIDRGSQEVVAQKSVNNILRVKAEKPFSIETSLTVITSDGKLYSFVVVFSNDPLHLNINMAKTAVIKGDSSLIALTDQVLHMPGNLYGLKYTQGKVQLSLNGFYIKKQLMFCRLQIENRSQIGYDIEQFRMYIRDSKIAKRTSVQETEIKPVYISGDTAAIGGKTAQSIVIVVPKFTIPDGKHLAIEMMERNGGRSLYLTIHNRHVVLAKELK